MAILNKHKNRMIIFFWHASQPNNGIIAITFLCLSFLILLICTSMISYLGHIMCYMIIWSLLSNAWQKPLGLLSLLDEESTFPNATDLTFANKLKQHLSDSPCFKGERGGAFRICHYAGEVSKFVLFTWKQLAIS